MIRRITFAALFAAVALSATGCCGTFRNLVYRIRHCNGCSPAATGCCGDGLAVSPSYSTPVVDAGPMMGGPPAAGCSSCSSAAPIGPAYPVGAGVPMVPPYAMQPGSVPMAGGYPMPGGQVAGVK